jgi:hypothetical protein
MTKEFSEGGVSFRYPENWTLERDESGGAWTVTLQSKETAFLVITLDPTLPEPQEMAKTALEALRSEYPELEADSAVDMLAGELAVGHDIEFFSLDLANTIWTRALYCSSGTLLVYWQMTDLELPTIEPVVRAVCASLKIDE